MSTKLRWITLLGIMVMAAIAWVGVSSWRDSVMTSQRERALAAVEDLMAAERWAEASSAIRSFGREFGAELSTAEESVWRKLDIEASEQLGDLSRLVWLESRYPELVHRREGASLMITRTFAAAGQPEEADRLREVWRGREEQPQLWLALDVDRRFAANQPELARELLESVSFAGAADTGRLLRLAMMAPTPLEAWEALNAAAATAPESPDVRSFRAQILERLGAIEAARVEYVAALVAGPEDPVRRDQLAQFYLRHGGAAQALQTWRDGLTPTAPDFLWLRVLFWQRLFGGPQTRVPEAPVGRWTGLIEGLRQLSPTQFWSDPGIADPVQARLSAERPEVALLRLLEHLRSGREAAAWSEVVSLSSATRGLDPVGTAALQVVLRWRATELAPNWAALPVALPGIDEHVLIEQLRDWPGEGLPSETRKLLLGPHAWTALMLGAGWPQAALVMAGEGLKQPVAGVPDWYHFGLAAALRQERGPAAALAYLSAAPQAPVLKLLAAEIAIAEGQAEAHEQLEVLAERAGDIGHRASWILAVDALARDEGERARDWINGHPGLAQSVKGREMLARVALQSAQPELAWEIYQQLGSESLEAGMYLSRVAFAEKDWERARELTEALLAEFPAQVELRRNLEKIQEAQRRALETLPTP
jgi:hypothetical protein